MNRRILTRLLCIIFIALLSIFMVARKGIHLGLDLRGGVQLVLHVITDDAIRAETDRSIETLRQSLNQDKIAVQQITRTQIDEFTAAGIDASGDSSVRRIATDTFPGWDLSSSKNGYAMKLKSVQDLALREQAVQQVMRTVGNRLDSLGVGEVSIQRYGARTDDAIIVQVPGADNPEHVKSIVQSTAVLELRLVENGPFETEQTAAVSYGGSIPSQFEVLPYRKAFYVLQRVAPVSGRDLKNASSTRDSGGHPAVGFVLTADGARRFGGLTEQNIGKYLAIVLDKKLQSVAKINQKIEESGIIEGGAGGFTLQETQDLVLVLKSGSLPASIEYLKQDFIGPSLGADSIRDGIVAAAVALGAVTAFVLYYYRLSGVNAAIAMLMNLIILLGAMAYFGSTLTLPGIAGFVLTIGVGIDSNVLIFERIREELHAGKSAAAAVTVSFQRVFMTLVDTHLAALISAAFLFAFGTGAIQGFAVTLVIGLVSNMFTAVFVSRTLFECVLARKRGADTLSI